MLVEKERTLGFIRVFGPLGQATTLNFVLFPALGFAISLFFVPGRSKAFWGFVTFFFLTAIILTGSRSAVLALWSFFLLCLLVSRIRSLKVLVPIGALFGITSLFVDIPERYFALIDRSRTETYKTAYRTFSSRPRNVVIGVGNGGMYSMLHDNTMRRLHNRADDRYYLATKYTDFGFTLRSAHSTFGQVLVETGVVGFGLLIIPLLWMLRRLLGQRYRRARDPWTIQGRLVLASCVASMAFMTVNTFFFNLPWLVFIWILFAITGAETVAETSMLAETDLAHPVEEFAPASGQYSQDSLMWG